MTKFHAKWVKSMYSTMPHCQPEHTCKYQLRYILWFTLSCLRTKPELCKTDKTAGGEKCSLWEQGYIAIHDNHAQPCKTKLDIYSREHTPTAYVASGFGCVVYPLVTTVVPEHNKWLDVSLVKPIEMSNILCIYNCTLQQDNEP